MTDFIDWANGAPEIPVCIHGDPLCEHGNCILSCFACISPNITTPETELLDLRKIKDTVYDERAAILCAFVKLCVSSSIPCYLARHSAEDKSWDPAWMNIIVVILPTGQCTWHVSDTQLQQFGFLPFDSHFVWDGHTTPEKYDRLAKFDAQRIVDALMEM